MTKEAIYNQEICRPGDFSSIISREEKIDTGSLRVIRYSKPNDICEGKAIRLANMSGAFPFKAIGRTWRSTEHLYLLGEWSTGTEESKDIQQDVLTATSGYAAKRYKKNKHKKSIRKDFPLFRHQWMLWCVWQKCLTSAAFREHLLSIPDDSIIVEVVKKDPIWAAEEDESGRILTGNNGMGKILTICRQALKQGTNPPIDYALLGKSDIYILGEKIFRS